MQTFLPFEDFRRSAEVLDPARLGKQRVEVLQILKAIVENTGWIHHPATHMWRGHVNVLVLYGLSICDEWVKCGYADTCGEKIKAYSVLSDGLIAPPWLGKEDFHASHRSNLVRKGYTCFEEDGSLPYCWPIQRADGWYMRFKHAGVPKYEREYRL